MSRLKSVLIFASTVSTVFCLAVVYQLAQKSAAYSQSIGITDIAGVKVGHYTLQQRPTGCTVVLVEEGAVGGVDVRGFAPGTRETDLLDPVNTVQQIHAISLAGGSAFGLDAASGVVQYLEERGKVLFCLICKLAINQKLDQTATVVIAQLKMLHQVLFQKAMLALALAQLLESC